MDEDQESIWPLTVIVAVSIVSVLFVIAISRGYF
jgi:hypothetical protein